MNGKSSDVEQACQWSGQIISGNMRKNNIFLKSISSDNGSEFLNKDLLKHCNTRNGGTLKLCRRRPYKKNDAAHVEQKTWTHVRQLFGYYRLDDE
jgi:hypothetical protein